MMGLPVHCPMPPPWGVHPGQLHPCVKHCWHEVKEAVPVQEPTEASMPPLLPPIPLLLPKPLLLVNPLLEPKPLLLPPLLLPLDPPVKPGSAAL